MCRGVLWVQHMMQELARFASMPPWDMPMHLGIDAQGGSLGPCRDQRRLVDATCI